MSYQFPPELDAIVRQQMAAGNYNSEDELLLTALRSFEDKQADWAAVEESLDTLAEGEQGLSLRQHARNNVPVKLLV